MEGAPIRVIYGRGKNMTKGARGVIFCNPQHGWNEESTSSKILWDTPEMNGYHQHGAKE